VQTYNGDEVSRKVLDFIESFSTICGMPPTCKEIMEILDF
jgi:SOS-response transcriptional repressor LexA